MKPAIIKRSKAANLQINQVALKQNIKRDTKIWFGLKGME